MVEAMRRLENPPHSTEHELGRIDEMIAQMEDLHNVVFKQVVEKRNEDMGRRINGRIRAHMERDYFEELARACGPQLASSYQKRMSYSLNATPTMNNRIYGTVIGMASFSSNLMKGFTAFLSAFVLEVMRLCRELGIRRLVIFDRDGDVFYVIAKVLRENLFHDIEVKLEPINRRLFKIEDRPIGVDGKNYSQLMQEVGNRVLQDKHLLVYLKQVFGNGNKVAIIDSGVYGSIVSVIDYLHEIDAIKPKPFVFFFASRNPYIYGFVNQHLKLLPVPVTEWPCWLELFADTVEVLAKTHGSVEPLLTDKGVRLFSRPIQSPLYEAFSWGILVAVRDYALYELPEELDVMEKPDLLIKDLCNLYRDAIEAKAIPTLFLEHHAPPSPYGPAVLRGWNRGIIPPLDFLLGYDSTRTFKVRPECGCMCNEVTQE